MGGNLSPPPPRSPLNIILLTTPLSPFRHFVFCLIHPTSKLSHANISCRIPENLPPPLALALPHQHSASVKKVKGEISHLTYVLIIPLVSRSFTNERKNRLSLSLPLTKRLESGEVKNCNFCHAEFCFLTSRHPSFRPFQHAQGNKTRLYVSQVTVELPFHESEQLCVSSVESCYTNLTRPCRPSYCVRDFVFILVHTHCRVASSTRPPPRELMFVITWKDTDASKRTLCPERVPVFREMVGLDWSWINFSCQLMWLFIHVTK
jgi:hypothetical protein